MLDQCLKSGDTYKAAELATRIEKAYAGREVSAVEIAESGQGKR